MTENERIAIEGKIAELERELERCQAILRQCADASANLSIEAAQERQKHANAGGGFMGGLLGSKYRAAARRSASAARASISRQVTERKAEIQNLKQQTKYHERILKDQLKGLKAAIKQVPSSQKSASDSLDILKKLKEALDLGILTEAEYSEKREALVKRLQADIGV